MQLRRIEAVESGRKIFVTGIDSEEYVEAVDARSLRGEMVIDLAAVPIGAGLLAVLVAIALFSGVGITAIGPGGIFLTIALYGLTSLPSATIAGTAQLMFIATGTLGSAAYARSGDMSSENAGWIALLCFGSITGAFFGAWLNAHVSRDLFGLLLGVLAAVTGVLIVYRERRDLTSKWTIDYDSVTGKIAYAVLGFALGMFSGLLGVGGPVIAVPALVVLGVEMLPAVAAAQVQSIFIATFSFAGYLTQGAVSFTLGIALGIPLLAGTVVGWLVAHRIRPDRLKLALSGVLMLVAPYLAL